jgi:hypothetical protein
VQGPDPGWIETLFYHLRTSLVVVENALEETITDQEINHTNETPPKQAKEGCFFL